MPFALGLASMVAVDFAAADPALDGVEGQRLAVALDRTADRAQLAAARQRAAQRLKRDMAAPALQQPGTERLGRVVPGSANGERKCRREIKRVEADFALDIPFAVKRHRHAPAQPRAGDRAVEIVEGQLVAGQRHARGQVDVLRQRVRRLEIEQRREIDAANVQIDAGLGVLRPRFGGALRFGIQPGSRQSSPSAATARATRPSPIPRIAPGLRRPRSRDRARAAPARCGPDPTTVSIQC